MSFKISHAPKGYDCPFCAIVANRACDGAHSRAEDIVCRDEHALAFIASHWWPRNAGHVLVIPTQHFENIFDLPDDVGGAIHAMAKRIAIAMKRTYRCDGVSTRQHNEPHGDQEVWHYHLHVFPRWKDDRLYESGGDKRLTTPEQRLIYADQLRAALYKGEA